MEKLRLNTEKILDEMKRLGMNKTQLAEKLGVVPSMVTWIFSTAPISYAYKIGKLFKIEPRDLIK